MSDISKTDDEVPGETPENTETISETPALTEDDVTPPVVS